MSETRIERALRWWRNNASYERTIPSRHLIALRKNGMLTPENEDDAVDLSPRGNFAMKILFPAGSAEKKPAGQWNRRKDRTYEVYDPDGWRSFGISWELPISLESFEQLAMLSTIGPPRFVAPPGKKQ